MTKLRGQEARDLKYLRQRAYVKQHGLCFWCGGRMTLPIGTEEDATDQLLCSADHYPVPLHQGGKTIPGNVVATHRKCNQERHPELNRSKTTGNALATVIHRDEEKPTLSKLAEQLQNLGLTASQK